MNKCEICLHKNNCSLIPKNNPSIACELFKKEEMNNLPEFKKFKKIPRLSREIIITEKLDGTSGLIFIDENNNIFAGSRNRWLDEHNDNYGFYYWIMDNKEELLKLGKGYHYGEWMGKGIQRNYGLNEKRFYLFNVNKWWDKRNDALKEGSKQKYCPKCCYVVPTLYAGFFDTNVIEKTLNVLKVNGSIAVPNYNKPEGIVIYHLAGGYYFKKTIENDQYHKGENK